MTLAIKFYVYASYNVIEKIRSERTTGKTKTQCVDTTEHILVLIITELFKE